MTVTLICAVARNGVIGANGKLPWRLPGDLRRFKRATIGKAVVLGRETYLSIGRPLPERTNIVLSTREDFAPAGVVVARSLEEALRIAREHSAETMVLGGAKVYAQALAHADKLLLTIVDCAPEGDAFFPAFAATEWLVTKREHFAADADNAFACEWLELERKSGAVASGEPLLALPWNATQ